MEINFIVLIIIYLFFLNMRNISPHDNNEILKSKELETSERVTMFQIPVIVTPNYIILYKLYGRAENF